MKRTGRALVGAAAFATALLCGGGAEAQEHPEHPPEGDHEAWYAHCRAYPREEWTKNCRDAFTEIDHSAWRRGAVFSLVIENDALVGPDRDYTNGMGAVLSLPPRSYDNDNPVDNINNAIDKRFHAFFGRELSNDITYRGAWRFAQHLYTPEDLLAPVPDPNDRPYAAWTYMGYGQTSERLAYRRNRTPDDLPRMALSTTQIDVGMVGPTAGGEAIQRWFHEVIDAEVDPQGWGYQLADEPGIVLRHERKFILRCDDCVGDVDMAFDRFGGFALGNIDTSASLGGAVRIGSNFGWDHGPPRLRPSLDGASYFAHEGGSRWGGYVFAGATARWVGRNIFLDGNTFFDSASVPKQPFVGDLQVGGVALLGPVKLTLSHVVRSEEFYGQGRMTQFDSLAMSFRF